MYTECPECKTIFRISEAQLQAADGKVRCGECMSVFDGQEHRLEKLPAEAEEQQSEELENARIMKGEAATGSPDDELDIDSLLSEGDSGDAGGAAETPELRESEPAKREEVPRDRAKETKRAGKARKPKKKSKGGATFVWSLLILVLIATLLGQYGYYHRLELAQYPTLRPALVELCAAIGCELPPRRDLEAIEFVDRQVRSHPKFEDALLITGTFANQADFAQPYPTIELVLRDIAGNLVASRAFKPPEYLPQEEFVFFPGQEAELMLEVTDPGEEAVSFEFSFR